MDDASSMQRLWFVIRRRKVVTANGCSCFHAIFTTPLRVPVWEFCRTYNAAVMGGYKSSICSEEKKIPDNLHGWSTSRWYVPCASSQLKATFLSRWCNGSGVPPLFLSILSEPFNNHLTSDQVNPQCCVLRHGQLDEGVFIGAVLRRDYHFKLLLFP